MSCGNQAGLTVEDYVEFLVEDEYTAVVGAFVEGFKQARASSARAAARARELRKPIVVLKVGRSENARQAMLAHTGSLAGTPEIIDAVLRQSGVVQVVEPQRDARHARAPVGGDAATAGAAGGSAS